MIGSNRPRRHRPLPQVLTRTREFGRDCFATQNSPTPTRVAIAPLAARFAKEAFLKSPKSGLGAVRFSEIEVVRHDDGHPELVLHGEAAVFARGKGAGRFEIIPYRHACAGGRGGAARVIPIVTPAEMAAIDAAAPCRSLRSSNVPARRWLAPSTFWAGRLDGAAIIAGKGNNGADDAAAATRLQRRARCVVLDPDIAALPIEVDLVIDAAYGTGLSRPYDFPTVPEGVPVLAVDIPSGVDGLTGARLGSPVAADRTITFAALKPGLLLEPGRELSGEVVVADIGLDTSDATIDLVEGSVVAVWLTVPAATVHKWHHAIRIIGGSSTMTGAPRLAARSAQRLGAGYVQMAIPARRRRRSGRGGRYSLPASAWGAAAVADLDRVAAVLVVPDSARP